MTTPAFTPASAGALAGRQVSLPMSKAVQIAYENIRLRLSRSLLVTSGIVLALAFLISILVNNAMVDGMRRWVAATETSPRFAELQSRRKALEAQLVPLAAQVRAAVPRAKGASGRAAAADLDAEKGRWDALRDQVGALPVPTEQLIYVEHSGDAGRRAVGDWAAVADPLAAVRQELNAPQQLEAMMKKNGVPTTPEEIRNDRIQTRWLLGLALLVAFIGILNAMLMSVTERFREIGTMKCLGALDGFIIRLFLIESFFQGIVGTIVGMIVGVGLSTLSATFSYGGYAWKNPPVGGILAAAGFCFVVGMALTIAGALYPAWQAARMQPIAAMRVDA